MTTHNILTCLFGHHQYSKELTLDRDGYGVHLCKICKRKGYWEWHDEKILCDFDENRNMIHSKWTNGNEFWYFHDEKGNTVCTHELNGETRWLNSDGYWVYKKPKNWKHEKDSQ